MKHHKHKKNKPSDYEIAKKVVEEVKIEDVSQITETKNTLENKDDSNGHPIKDTPLVITDIKDINDPHKGHDEEKLGRFFFVLGVAIFFVIAMFSIYVSLLFFFNP